MAFCKYVYEVSRLIDKFITKTPLELNTRLSEKYNCKVYLKREDMQVVRSFKVRGALNKILSLSSEDIKKGVVCASAGNHASGVAYACNNLDIKGEIFVPLTTPLQKINRIKYYGKKKCNINIIGNVFDDSLVHAIAYGEKYNKIFIHPYDDKEVIAGQATVAKEIFDTITPDIIVSPIGGGGLISGISKYTKQLQKKCQIIGIQSESAPAMHTSYNNNVVTKVPVIDAFVDGGSVSMVGKETFKNCKEYVDDIKLIPIGRLCQEMLDLYNNDGIIVEPTGALSVAGLDTIGDLIRNKTVVCVLSGGNNDVKRYHEVEERYLRYKNLKHYYIVKFIQKPGELRKFINNILGEKDDIVRFEYLKKTEKEHGNVLMGIEVENAENINKIEKQMNIYDFKYVKINENELLFSYLV
jgi:threonine dehydratase